MAILEIDGRFTCSCCGYAWSAMMGDDEIPSHCECDNINGSFAFFESEMFAQWERTMHCIEGVIENHKMNAAAGNPVWSIWTHNLPQDVYLSGNGNVALDTGPSGVGKRGAHIIAECVQFADVDTELPERLMDEWSNEIQSFGTWADEIREGKIS